ncbi:EAL domain-containing protein [Bradyrhizobium australafricanum]|uniref:EAL domain-containing protein n=1 Tax=Bradyrhizobium australafricanum TaxID=2821406 RepID=UPI001CE285AE|nr:EAL domain-containing protein [Bradyrhizobium australafricanum]MCA6102131.1 EAL domain-containing protein [Bradyrhizobium australafricanum]
MRECSIAANRDDPQDPAADTVFLLVVINNFDKLAAAYDQSLASVVSDVLHRRALSFCGESAGIVRLAAGRFVIVMRWASRFANVASLADGATAAIGGEPIRFAGAAVLAAVSVRVLPPNLGRSDVFGKAASSGRIVEPVREDAAWSLQYRTDMAAAVATVDALREGCLSPAWQPVCHASQPECVLYWERLLRVSTHDGPAQSASAAILAMERLGLIRRMDHWVINRVISELRSTPKICIGCNISARSAVLDHGWMSVIARLRQLPDVASRLIVEVTETARLPPRMIVREFVDALRSVGCRIAVDDFGAGNGCRKALTSLRPDLVKIDATFLHRARNDRIGRSRLLQLVRFASRLGGILVVEGVETLPDAHLAQEVGATWLQGYLFGERSRELPRSACPDDGKGCAAPAATNHDVVVGIEDRRASAPGSSIGVGCNCGRTVGSSVTGPALALLAGHLVSGLKQPVIDLPHTLLAGGVGCWFA